MHIYVNVSVTIHQHSKFIDKIILIVIEYFLKNKNKFYQWFNLIKTHDLHQFYNNLIKYIFFKLLTNIKKHIYTIYIVILS